jgi:hypothetical protein
MIALYITGAKNFAKLKNFLVQEDGNSLTLFSVTCFVDGHGRIWGVKLCMDFFSSFCVGGSY